MEWYHNGIPTLHRNCNVSEHGRQEARRLLENPMLLLKFFFPLYYCACIHQIIRMGGGRLGGWRGLDSDGKVFPGLGIIGHNRQFPS
jgi:hypothetical protein